LKIGTPTSVADISLLKVTKNTYATLMSTESLQEQRLFKINFHRVGDYALDGFFVDIPAGMIPQILNNLPPKWVAVIYDQTTNIPLTTHGN
jgi:hypothetical protein